MTGPFRFWRRLSLRVQLLVIVSVLVLAALGILGVTSVSYLRHNLTQSAKESAYLISNNLFFEGHKAESIDDFEYFDPKTGVPKVSLNVNVGDFFIAVQGDQSYTEYRTDEQGDVRITADQIAQLEAIPYLGSRPIRVDIEGLGPFLVAESSVGSGGTVSWGRMYVGVSMTDVDQVVEEFIQREALYACVLSIGIVALASLVIFQSLRPLQRVTRIANRVAERPLSEGEVALPDRVHPVDPKSKSEADRLAMSFNRMLENVETSLQTREQAERSMQRFVAEASHELRNPLAAIRGYAEYGSNFQDVPAETLSALERIEVESTRLARLADELLLLARVDAGRSAELEVVDLSLIVLETVEDCRVRWPQHFWQIDLPQDPVELIGSDDTLRRILINLASNAGEHTPPGTRVSVAVETNPDHVNLTVTDDGPGIAQDALPTIFDRFTQAKSSQQDVRDSGNSGLGLAIVKALADEAGYRVRVESYPSGTVFTIEIPRTCE